MTRFTEDTLVQQTTADYLRDQLGWESVYAYNDEVFGPESTLGREDDREVVLTLIQKFNKDVDPSTPYSTRDDIIVITRAGK